jgi:hypothetical protein
VLTSLASNGYLKGSRKTSQSLAAVISLFTTTTSASGTLSSFNTSSSSSQYPVDLAVTGLVQGIILGMASGEAPVSLVTSNVQVSVSSQVITDLTSKAFRSPATTSQAAYGDIQPIISLGIDGLSKCKFSGGYAKLSIMEWGENPYKGSTAVQSTLLRFSVSSILTSKTSNPKTLSKESSSRRLSESIAFNLSSVPAYYISLQFLAVQDFNFTASSVYSKASTTKFNFTLPECTLYNGFTYVPCQGCYISSYTNYNVTYSCYDITQLCPPTEVNVRRSLSERYTTLARENRTTTVGLELSRSDSVLDKYTRVLQALDGTANVVTTANTFGVIVKSVLAELANVLSINPFALNLNQATAVLAFTGSLVGFILILLVFFTRLDDKERIQKVYVKKEQCALATKLVQEDMKNGGHGDIGASFHKYIYQLNDRNTVAEKVRRITKSVKDEGLSSSVFKLLKGEGKTTILDFEDSRKANHNRALPSKVRVRFRVRVSVIVNP